MDADVIDKLFMKVAATVGHPVPEDAKRVFSVLVSSTLKYRDHLKEELGVTVTVEDVRVALDWLLESIQTKHLPETDNEVQLDLLRIWLDELKIFM